MSYPGKAAEESLDKHRRHHSGRPTWLSRGKGGCLVAVTRTSSFQADVILKYTTDEARILKNEGQLPESARLNENDDQDQGEVEFGERRAF